MFVFFVFFFFKQKTAYEMRISDWSSDVCSSDLLADNNCSKDDAALNPPKKKAPSRPGKQTVTTPLTRSKDAKKLSTGKKVEVGTRMSGTPVKAVSLQHAELLENARMQWQFGDWESLVKLDPGTLEKHPDRDKLALLAASAPQQMKDRKRVGEGSVATG